MSTGWSLWIMFLVVLNMGITLFLFLWARRVSIPTREDGTSGHVWAHGTVREGVRKLPTWWVLLSASMFIIGIGYLILFPGFGSYKGLLGWTSEGRLERVVSENNALLKPVLERAAGTPLSELARDPQATRIGHRLFQDNCAACHGTAGRGNQVIGAPDLSDDVWLYGGDEESLLHSIHQGRNGMMPGWSMFGYGRVKNLAHYVRSLSGVSHDTAAAAAGQKDFSVCAACHGPDGQGNPALGAPDLTDDVWLYGGSLEKVMESISAGRQGQMPAWEGRLSDVDIRLITAWILHHADITATE